MSDHTHTYIKQPSIFGNYEHDVCAKCHRHRTSIERDAATQRIDMTHTGCGGYLTNFSYRGHDHIYRCDKCNAEVIAEMPLDAMERVEADRARRDAEHEERMRTWVAPEPTGRELTAAELHLLDEYSMWSEDRYCAGFMSPSPDTVREFRAWKEGTREVEARRAWDYELEMLDEYVRQTEIP